MPWHKAKFVVKMVKDILMLKLLLQVVRIRSNVGGSNLLGANDNFKCASTQCCQVVNALDAKIDIRINTRGNCLVLQLLGNGDVVDACTDLYLELGMLSEIHPDAWWQR